MKRAPSRRSSSHWTILAAILLVSSFLISRTAVAGLVDDIRNFITALDNVNNVTTQTCNDAAKLIIDDATSKSQIILAIAAKEKDLATAGSKGTAKVLMLAKQQQAASQGKITNATIASLSSMNTQADQLANQASIITSQLPFMEQALNDKANNATATATLNDITNVKSLVTALKDRLSYLATHPWEFDGTEIQNKLNVINQAVSNVSMDIAKAVAAAIRPDLSNLQNYLSEIEKKRLQAQALAAQAQDLLDKALGRAHTTSPAPANPEPAPTFDPAKIAAQASAQQKARWEALSARLKDGADLATKSYQRERPKPPKGKAGTDPGTTP
jgi:hypothetical protein